MNCVIHPSREATGVCQRCGRPVCPDCTVVVGDQTYCDHCGSKFQPRRPLLTNGVIRTLLSIIPGLGHLYIGLPQRGVQLFLAMVASNIVVEGFLDLNFGPLITFAFIFYSIFDARELALRQSEGEPVADRPLVDLGQIMEHKDKLGYGLIALGALGVYRMLSQIVARYLSDIARPMDYLTFGVVAIAAGIYLLRKPGKSA